MFHFVISYIEIMLVVEIFLRGDNDLFITHGHYPDCWDPGDDRESATMDTFPGVTQIHSLFFQNTLASVLKVYIALVYL